MIYFVLGFLTLSIWFLYGILNNRAKKAEQETRDLYEAIKEQQITKAKLRNDAEYAKRVHDEFND